MGERSEANSDLKADRKQNKENAQTSPNFLPFHAKLPHIILKNSQNTSVERNNSVTLRAVNKTIIVRGPQL